MLSYMTIRFDWSLDNVIINCTWPTCTWLVFVNIEYEYVIFISFLKLNHTYAKVWIIKYVTFSILLVHISFSTWRSQPLAISFTQKEDYKSSPASAQYQGIQFLDFNAHSMLCTLNLLKHQLQHASCMLSPIFTAFPSPSLSQSISLSHPNGKQQLMQLICRYYCCD